MSIDHMRAYGAIANPSPYPSENVGRGFVQNTSAHAKALLDAMSDEQRAELFSNYCKSCGCKDPRCQCWNDKQPIIICLAILVAYFILKD